MTNNSTIFNDHFLLHNEAGRNLFFNYAKDLPIIDYHNHLPPVEIAENKKFTNLTEIWLKGDHYKWRAMRALGIKESHITGNETDEEKFMAWADCMPKLLRNPLFQWSQMELKTPFGVNEYLNPSSAKNIYPVFGVNVSIKLCKSCGEAVISISNVQCKEESVEVTETEIMIVAKAIPTYRSP
jgi:glucuronate isomerase